MGVAGDEYMTRHYAITWIRGKLNSTECWLGICAKTRGLYHIENRDGLAGMAPFVVHDVIVGQNGCEERERCMCQRCLLNQTTPASYWKGHALPGPPPKKHSTFSDFILPDDLPVEAGKIITSRNGGPIIELKTGQQ